MMSGHCSLSVGIAQQTLQSCCREMWKRAFSIQFLSSNYTFSKSGWLIHRVTIILTKHATVIRYSNSDPWPLFPIFDWSKLLAGVLKHFWPRSRIVNHAGLATQTVSGSALIIKLNSRQVGLMMGITRHFFCVPGFCNSFSSRLKTSGCSIHHSSPALRSFCYCSGKTTGRMTEGARFDSRQRQEHFIRSSKLWYRLWIPVSTGGSVSEVKEARTWSWPHHRLPRI